MKRPVTGFFLLALGAALGEPGAYVQPPRFWNDRDLAEWATPVAGLNRRPGHYTEQQYYSAPAGEFLRTYSVYFPGREPAGHWEMLQNAKPDGTTHHARPAVDGGLNRGRQKGFS